VGGPDPVETETIAALTAHVQKLGSNRGRWRAFFEPSVVEGSAVELPRSDIMIAIASPVMGSRVMAMARQQPLPTTNVRVISPLVSTNSD